MIFKTKTIAALCFIAWAATVSIANAETIRIGNQGDALSMDPHSLNESLQISVTGNMFEGLTARGKNLELLPGLATSWKQTAPTIWRFELRQGAR